MPFVVNELKDQGGKKNSPSENVAYYRAEEKDCISAC